MRDHDLCLEEYVQGLEDGSIQNPALNPPAGENAEQPADAETTEELLTDVVEETDAA